MATTAIILLNYNSTDDTVACIKSLYTTPHTSKDAMIIVVDNHSKKSEVQKLTQYIDTISKQKNNIIPIHFIKNDKNLGFSGGNNVGIEYALKENVENILILNNDTIVDKNFLQKMTVEMEKDSKIGVVVPKIYFAPGHEYHTQRYTKEELGKVIWYAGGTIDWKNVIGHHEGVDEVDTDQYTVHKTTEYATGACMLVRASVFQKIGMFDTDYFLYYEDSDISMRIKKAGYTINFNPDSIIWHKNAGSTGGSGSDLQDYYITRNRLIFGFRYAPLRAKLALLKEAGKQLITGRTWQKKGIRDFFIHKLGKGSYPISD